MILLLSGLPLVVVAAWILLDRSALTKRELDQDVASASRPA